MVEDPVSQEIPLKVITRKMMVRLLGIMVKCKDMMMRLSIQGYDEKEDKDSMGNKMESRGGLGYVDED